MAAPGVLWRRSSPGVAPLSGWPGVSFLLVAGGWEGLGGIGELEGDPPLPEEGEGEPPTAARGDGEESGQGAREDGAGGTLATRQA